MKLNTSLDEVLMQNRPVVVGFMSLDDSATLVTSLAYALYTPKLISAESIPGFIAVQSILRGTI